MQDEIEQSKKRIIEILEQLSRDFKDCERVLDNIETYLNARVQDNKKDKK